MGSDQRKNPPLYEIIYYVVKQIPYGKVATYGQISRITGGCTARMVGYAMSALKPDQDVPWQRVINSKGEVSQHGDGFGTALQKELLMNEGIIFDLRGRINFDIYGWEGPDWNWKEDFKQNDAIR